MRTLLKAVDPVVEQNHTDIVTFLFRCKSTVVRPNHVTAPGGDCAENMGPLGDTLPVAN